MNVRMRPIVATLAMLLAAVSAAFYGYRSALPQNNRVAPSSIAANRIVNISFERTGCYGTCPVYVLMIDGSGHTRLILDAFPENAVEEGHRDLSPVKVVYEWTLPETQRRAIADIVDSHHFRSLDLDYFISVTDNETRTISLSTNRGHWSTSVYAVPCESQAREWDQEYIGRMETDKFVPDVFCDAQTLLHQAACDTMQHGTHIGRRRNLRLFHPPSCRR